MNVAAGSEYYLIKAELKSIVKASALSIQTENQKLNSRIIKLNQPKRDANNFKSCKKWFDISPMRVTRSGAGKVLPAF